MSKHKADMKSFKNARCWMTRKSRNDGLDTMYVGDRDYHAKCWEEFTRLTPQERENLRDRARVFKQIKRQTRLFT